MPCTLILLCWLVDPTQPSASAEHRHGLIAGGSMLSPAGRTDEGKAQLYKQGESSCCHLASQSAMASHGQLSLSGSPGIAGAASCRGLLLVVQPLRVFFQLK